MSGPTIPTLLGAVGRHLWRRQVLAVVRTALWASAGLMLVGAAVHLAVLPLPASAVAWTMGWLWAAALVRAVARPPRDTVCALWADRHLGGASAFSTWLELRAGQPGNSDQATHVRLETWAAAQVPAALQRLADQAVPARLARPLVSLAVCGALAALVMALSDPAPLREPHSAAASAAADPQASAMSAAATSPLPPPANDLRNTLQAAAAGGMPARRAGGQAPAAGSDPAADDAAAPTAGAPARAAAGLPADRQTPANAAADESARTGATAATGPGSGRRAGDMHDGRTDPGSSPVPPPTIAAQRPTAGAGPSAGERRADPDRSATYRDDPSTRAVARRAGPAVAAAVPPPARAEVRLSAAETRYVHSWLMATAAQR